MPLADAFSSILVVIIVVLFAIALVTFTVMVRNGHVWLQAHLAGVPLSLFHILGMRFRKTDVNAVVRTLIAARQGGVTLSCQEVERAYLQGADLEKITLAMIEAKKRGMDLTFQELVDADREHRLAEKLNM